MRMTTLRVLVLGDHKVGKSAVTVRFLTKRFIGEYYSDTDHVYRYTLRHEDSCTDVEICDTCSKACGSGSILEEEGKLAQADAFVLVFSVCSRGSFLTATNLLRALARQRPISTSSASTSTSFALPPTLLLGNMTDLEHLRQVEEEEGRQVALSTGCLYYEVSAAENAQSVDEAFSAILTMASSCVPHRSVLKRRRSSLGRRIGGLFSKAALGGGGSNNNNNNSNSSGSFSCSSKGNPSSCAGRNLVSSGRNGNNNAVENAKSFSIVSHGSNSHNNNTSSRLKRGDANNNSSSSSKDKARDAGNGSGDPTDRKLTSVVNRDRNSLSSSFSSASFSSSSYTTSRFTHLRSCASTGSEVYIADALRRRASLVAANSNRPIGPGDNCDKRKMSLPILPEEMPRKTLSECFEH